MLFRSNQVSFRRGNLLDVIQAPPERFRQGHAARFIRGERVDLLFGRIMHRLAHRFAVCVLELKRRMRQRDGLARFSIRLEDTQAVENRTVAECQHYIALFSSFQAHSQVLINRKSVKLFLTNR